MNPTVPFPQSDDVQDHMEITVDQDAEPADWDGSLARFLLSYVRSKQSRSTAADPAVEQDEHHGLVDAADMGE